MYKRILVATDGSRYSEAAMNEAIKLAKESDGTIIIVSAIDVTEEFEIESPGLTERLVKQFKALVEDMKKRAEAEGIKAEAIVDEGEPYEVIVNTAKQKDVNIIVMGSHGRTGIMRLLMGSVTSRVIGHAGCSVLVVKT
ncbi:MAG: universal stress protein [Nitrospirota bacterium]